jgi:hypothetical protein
LFYVAPDGQLVAVPIQLGSTSEPVKVGSPVRLFASMRDFWAGSAGTQYLVSRDGLRFLINTLSEEVNTSPITVILNWHPKS